MRVGPLCVVFSFLCLTAAQTKTIDDGVLIKNVTIVSPERSSPLAHAAVAIRDGKIAEIGTDLIAGQNPEVIDGHAGFLIPGLIDSHVHVGNQGPLGDDALEKHP